MNKMSPISNKLNLHMRIIMCAIMLLSAISAVANSDTLKTEILHKALRLIGEEDSLSHAMCYRIDSVSKMTNLSDSAFVIFMSRDVGNYFRRIGQQSNAIEIFSDVVDMLERRDNTPEIKLKLYIPLGAAFEEVGLWSVAMEYYHNALRIAQDNNLQGDIARIYNNIGAAYYRTDIKKSEEYMVKSLEINTKLADRSELFLNYNNLAAVYLQQGNYDEALDHALLALHMIDKHENADLYHGMQFNIGTLHFNKNEYHLAISFINDAREYFHQVNNYSELVPINIYLAQAYEKIGQHVNARQCMKLIEDSLLPNVSNNDVEAYARTTLSEYYESINDYYKAYCHLHEASVLKDSLTIANDKRKISNLEQIYDNEQKLRANAHLINEMKINKMRTDRSVMFIIIALIILVLIIIILIIRSQLQSKLHKSNAQLVEQQLTIQEKEKELQQIKEKELSRAIDQKNRELSSYALSYTKDNEFLMHLSEELKQLLLEINPRDKEHKEHIRSILAQIKQHNNADNWQEFRYYFEQVHPSFYDKIDEISPGITQHQKRLCAMLYIGLSTKEISSITFREVRSIESARNRLRKKFQIPADETIQEFLSRKMAE